MSPLKLRSGARTAGAAARAAAALARLTAVSLVAGVVGPRLPARGVDDEEWVVPDPVDASFPLCATSCRMSKAQALSHTC